MIAYVVLVGKDGYPSRFTRLIIPFAKMCQPSAKADYMDLYGRRLVSRYDAPATSGQPPDVDCLMLEQA